MKTKYSLLILTLYFFNHLVIFSQNIDNDTIKYNYINQKLNKDSVSFADTLFFDKGENQIINNDSILSLADTTIKIDTFPKKTSSAVLESKVEYNSKDSSAFSVDGKKIFLFGKAEIKYENIALTAGYIEIDMENDIIYAEGIKDSLDNFIDEPIFTQNNEEVQAKTITYNLRTKKGYIRGLYSQQEEGYLHSLITKKEPNNQINLHRGKYTTCDLKHPHFYLWLSKGKVIPDKAIVSSYAFLVIADVPLYPLMIPFGYFPSTQERASGFLFPTFGEEQNRGFFLQNGGYYFAINQYADLTLVGSVYSKGSWQVNARSQYKKRYKFSGLLNASYSKIVATTSNVDKKTGKLFVNESNQYSIQWNHTQDSKARPNSNFNANVNFSSMDNNRYNSNNNSDYLTNTTNSSISYRKNFANTPFNMSMNLKHSQNTQTKIIHLVLPHLNVNMNRIFPFKRKVAVGSAKWYEKIGFSYSGNFENKSQQLHDSVMFKKEMWEHFSAGANHNIPFSLNLKLLKHFNLTPGISFKDRMYFKRDIRVYRNDTNAYDIRTEKGFYNIYDYSFSVGTNTTIYGMYQFKSKWLKGIRHVANPYISLNYRPDFSDEIYGFYVRDTNENRGFYNPYEKYNIYGMPGTGKSGGISFGLSNNLEMKVIDKKDTTQNDATKKIKLIDNLSLSGSYNLIADSLNWSPISINARTTLFKKLGITLSATANLYALDSAGKGVINTFNYKVSNELVRFTNFNVSTGYTFNSTDFFKKEKNENGGENQGHEGHHHGDDDYDYFDIPWSFSFNYNYNYRKNGFKSKTTQTLSFSGDFSLTPKWKIGFSSGWDFETQKISHTSFNLTRDLHCWIATLNVIPFGERKSFNFTIGVRSGILKDLKYDKQKSWYDNYTY